MNTRFPYQWIAPAVALALAGLTPLPALAEAAVAGLAPFQRPAGAPVINDVERSAAWRTGALHGVSPPHPPSLRFLDNQGAWHNPFVRAGMTAPYDLRGWHATARPTLKNK